MGQCFKQDEGNVRKMLKEENIIDNSMDQWQKFECILTLLELGLPLSAVSQVQSSDCRLVQAALSVKQFLPLSAGVRSLSVEWQNFSALAKNLSASISSEILSSLPHWYHIPHCKLSSTPLIAYVGLKPLL